MIYLRHSDVIQIQNPVIIEECTLIFAQLLIMNFRYCFCYYILLGNFYDECALKSARTTQ